MTVLRHARRLSAVAGLAVLPLLAFAPGASAAHESSNRLDFDAVASPTADGGGRINYVKGASGESEEDSVWQQSLRFTGLAPGEYTVVVKKGEGDGEVVPGSRDRVICTFTATATGTGTCTGRFLGCGLSRSRSSRPVTSSSRRPPGPAHRTRREAPSPRPPPARSPATVAAASRSRAGRSAPRPAEAEWAVRPALTPLQPRRAHPSSHENRGVDQMRGCKADPHG